MMNDSDVLLALRARLRAGQDSGRLPFESTPGPRFQVAACEVAVPLLRHLVTTFCLEGVTAHLIMALDETIPYVGLEVLAPQTILCLYPSTMGPEILISVQGGAYPQYSSLRVLSYRGLAPSILESVLVEQLQLVLCPPQPII